MLKHGIPEISIHALREEGDIRRKHGQATSPRFLSTPSARRATSLTGNGHEPEYISIHALREEGDLLVLPQEPVRYEISIHALREEGDLPRVVRTHQRRNFYPRPPRGGRRSWTTPRLQRR